MFHQIEAALSDHLTGEQTSASDSHTPSADAQFMSRLNALMMEHRLYTKPDLTIEEVAVQVGESYRTVSSAINSGCNTNFRGWVNSFRVEEAERLMDEGYLREHTIDALAAVVGFANRISFYRVFKKHTGMSPTDRR
jgi:AraC-like DNA-binding protein